MQCLSVRGIDQFLKLSLLIFSIKKQHKMQRKRCRLDKGWQGFSRVPRLPVPSVEKILQIRFLLKHIPSLTNIIFQFAPERVFSEFWALCNLTVWEPNFSQLLFQ